jgi:transcription elongation factor GreA-like protein
MGNMSYCRFENTMDDLKDCLRNIDHEAENDRDESARQEMIELFREIYEDWDGNIIEYALYL